MQRSFSLILIILLAAVGGGYLYRQKSDADARVKIEESLADARRSFADQARAAVGRETESEYRAAIQSALKSYDESLAKDVYAVRPEWRDVESYKKEVETRFSEGALKEMQRRSMLEGFELVQKAYERLKSGNWRSTLTAKGAGDVRIDIYDLRRVEDQDGRPVLEGNFFFWGIEDSTRVRWGQLAVRHWSKWTEEDRKKLRRAATKSDERVLGRSEGSAQPRIMLQKPNVYMEEFPSYVALGVVRLPMIPAEATRIDIEFGVDLQKGGANHEVKFEWEGIEVPPSWKLGEGEAWEADEVEATEEELLGKEPGAP